MYAYCVTSVRLYNTPHSYLLSLSYSFIFFTFKLRSSFHYDICFIYSLRNISLSLTPNPRHILYILYRLPFFLKVGEDRLIRFSGCKSGSACTIILRGASSHLLDEAERSLHDALCVLTETVKETRYVCVCVCMCVFFILAYSVDFFLVS